MKRLIATTKHQILKSFFTTLLSLGAWKATAVVFVPGLANTGVDSSGSVLPLHSVDPHYAVSGAASVAYVVPKATHPVSGFGWMPAPSGAAWIGPNATANPYPADPVGTYNYRLTFDLTGLDTINLQISGFWATDNSGTIWLNGQDTGISKGFWGFVQLDQFVISDGFLPGINTLEFRVVNGPSGPPTEPDPSGLLVTDLAASVVPEPSVAAMFLLGGAVLAMNRSRKTF